VIRNKTLTHKTRQHHSAINTTHLITNHKKKKKEKRKKKKKKKKFNHPFEANANTSHTHKKKKKKKSIFKKKTYVGEIYAFSNF